MNRNEAHGDVLRTSAAEDQKFNRRVRVRALAMEILRNGSSLMTMAEAVQKAERLLDGAQAGFDPIRVVCHNETPGQPGGPRHSANRRRQIREFEGGRR